MHLWSSGGTTDIHLCQLYKRPPLACARQVSDSDHTEGGREPSAATLLMLDLRLGGMVEVQHHKGAHQCLSSLDVSYSLIQ